MINFEVKDWCLIFLAQGEAATVHCEGEECDGLGLYVTNICSGQPSFDSGKFHNHCKSCP